LCSRPKIALTVWLLLRRFLLLFVGWPIMLIRRWARSGSHSYYLNSDDEIDPDLAHRLISMIGQPTKRSKKRLKSNHKVKAIIGLEQIIDTLNPDKEVETEEDPLADDSQILYNMGLIPMEKKTGSIFENIQNTSDDEDDDDESPQNLSDVWEPFSSNDESEENSSDSENNKSKSGSHWKIENYSSGGFCLNYDTDGSCRIRVGEIIAIRDTNHADQTIQWLTGTIRWMQSTPRESSRIGVELFGAECALITAQCKKDSSSEYQGLLLKKIEDEQKKFSLLVPTRVSFDTNDIMLVGKTSERGAILGQTLEKTSSFTHFEILEIANRNNALSKL
ncbi:MAG: hypothetical protein AAF372_03080, partial [Pseudomonadota bacterium]